MKQYLHIIQQTPAEPTGHLLVLAKEMNLPVKVHLVGQDSLSGVTHLNTSGLVLLGGPMSAVDDKAHPTLPQQRALVRLAVEKDLPLLGICLGAQIISSAMGGEVFQARAPEVGWGRVALTQEGKICPLFKGVPERFDTIQWHFDTFTIPPGTRKIAWGQRVSNQAIWAGKSVFGLQFHTETDEAMRSAWFTREELKNRYALFQRQTAQKLKTHEKERQRLLVNFLKLVQQKS